jgi:hypothetical protein
MPKLIQDPIGNSTKLKQGIDITKIFILLRETNNNSAPAN